jgi:phosphoserine phosphatase
LMKLVGHPRPVNPRSGLAAMAVEQGWPILRVAGSGRRRGWLKFPNGPRLTRNG